MNTLKEEPELALYELAPLAGDRVVVQGIDSGCLSTESLQIDVRL